MYLFGNEDTFFSFNWWSFWSDRENFPGNVKLIGNVKERSAVVFIRLMEVYLSLLNEHKKGRVTKTVMKWKPEMNLPARPGWVCQQETADGFPNSFF